MKRCSRCGIISLKSNFHKNKTKNDALTQHCKLFRKGYRKRFYTEQYDLEINRRRKYRFDIEEKINDYKEKKKESDSNFILFCNLGSRIYKAFKSQNVTKINKTFDLLGCSHSFFQRSIVHQLYGNMTIGNYGSVWQIDHCLPIASFNLLDEKDMKKCFNWINLRPMYSNENNSKKNKIDYHLYLLQEVKSKQFLKIND